jgi:hypothetical protein
MAIDNELKSVKLLEQNIQNIIFSNLHKVEFYDENLLVGFIDNQGKTILVENGVYSFVVFLDKKNKSIVSFFCETQSIKDVLGTCVDYAKTVIVK